MMVPYLTTGLVQPRQPDPLDDSPTQPDPWEAINLEDLSEEMACWLAPHIATLTRSGHPEHFTTLMPARPGRITRLFLAAYYRALKGQHA